MMKKHLALIMVLFLSIVLKTFSQGTYIMCDSIGVTTDSTGTLYDSGGPFGNYNNNEICTLLIAPTNAATISLTFSQFKTEVNYDYFIVIDGTTSGHPIIFNSSGHTLPYTVVATSGSMLIIWQSDYTGTDSGFACTWNTVICQCAPITGNVYNDTNNNCVFDNGEGLPNIPVHITDSNLINRWSLTDVNGFYSVMAPVAATSYLSINTGSSYNMRYIPKCPASGAISVTAPSSANDFGLECLPGFDLTGHLPAWQLRPGFVGTVCGFFNNRRCISPMGQIELIFDSGVTPLPDTAGIGYTISGQTITYPITSSDLQWSFCIPVLVSTTLVIGDTICVQMILQPISADADSLNNVETFCIPVVNSFDPNDKTVSPAGYGPNGAVLPNTPFTYTIRFQNTGNADAINIRVEDTLSQYLDISSLEIVATSHSMQWSCNNRILSFLYDNIMLPDSNANEAGSHGYVVFQISPLANTPHLSEITNMASIYFDFNQPILTNYTINTIDFFLSNDVHDNTEKVSLYPNPANGLCRIQFDDDSHRTISLLNMSGQLAGNYISHSKNFVMDTKFLSDGLYFVMVRNTNGAVTVVKMSVIH